MKLLYYGESPLNPTGFGHVNRHLLEACARVADVTLVATTHYVESYDRSIYPYEIIGCPNDPIEYRDMKHQRNLANIEKYVKAGEWDVFFYQGDMGWNNDVLVWAAEVQKAHPEKYTIFYMPIDGDVSIPLAFSPFTLCNVPVVYTNHAKSVVAKYAPDVAENLSVMWLGCESEVFHPLSREEKRQARIKLFGKEYLDRFLVLNVNRNQVRKDLARCMAGFHLFHKRHANSSLYMHSVQIDAGGSLPTQAIMVGCDIYKKPAEVMFSSLDLANPWSRETLNELYNAVDCLVSTAYGEGWGLATTEAMCAGLPVCVPANTANLDILGERQGSHHFEFERGWGMKTGGDLDHIAFLYQNGCSLASVTHAKSFVQTLQHIYFHRNEAQAKAQVAREWCLQNTWEHRKQAWVQLLQMMKSQSERPLQTTTAS
jgi:glycosyltransferase involved in cell wall biosynthesis